MSYVNRLCYCIVSDQISKQLINNDKNKQENFVSGKVEKKHELSFSWRDKGSRQWQVKTVIGIEQKNSPRAALIYLYWSSFEGIVLFRRVAQVYGTDNPVLHNIA